MLDLFGFSSATGQAGLKWRPTPLGKLQWPPDYNAVIRWRIDKLEKLKANPDLVVSAKQYYKKHKAEFIMDWMDTYDPRRDGSKWVPFVFFEKQMDVIHFFEDLERDKENGLVEKCRDAGLTWIACAYSVACWLFNDDDATGWGSRKEALVDKLGDPDSIFEKMRLIIKRLPPCFLPEGFNWARNSAYMKLLNPENGSIIAGEAGDNIGRGGRKTRYFLDEAAHLERPEKIESALGDNTNVRVDISSVNGLGNVFHNRREHGVVWEKGKKIDRGFVRVFIMDWRDHPLKTQDWYDARKARYEREGLAHIFAQEVDRNYSAAVSNVVIPQEWVRAAIDAHIKVPYIADGVKSMMGRFVAGLDVADDGVDRNGLTVREGIIWRKALEWGERDPGVTARRAIMALREYKGRVECQYDCIGVGAGVKTEYNRLTLDENVVNKNEMPFIPWNAGSGVLNPNERMIPDDNDSLMNKDYFDNLKAQAWQSLAIRFFKTFKAVTDGAVYPVEELISLDSTMPLLEQVCKELSQSTRGQSGRLKMLINKKPDGNKSPNLADAGVQMYFPVPNKLSETVIGNYGH